MTPGTWADVALHVFMMLIIVVQCFQILHLLGDREYWRNRAEAAQSAMACACELRELRAHEISIY